MKLLKTVILVALSVLLLFQLYWRCNYGSIIIYVQNQDSNSEFVSEVLIDNVIVAKYQFTNEDIIPHELSLQRKLGEHEISILRKDSGYRNTKLVRNYLVKWIVIEIKEDQSISIETQLTPPLLQ